MAPNLGRKSKCGSVQNRGIEEGSQLKSFIQKLHSQKGLHAHRNVFAQAAESDGTFSILQPGSSVATALSDGEAKKKHVVVLEVLGDQWRTFKFPLRTVRPFSFDQVSQIFSQSDHISFSRQG